MKTSHQIRSCRSSKDTYPFHLSAAGQKLVFCGTSTMQEELENTRCTGILEKNICKEACPIVMLKKLPFAQINQSLNGF